MHPPTSVLWWSNTMQYTFKKPSLCQERSDYKMLLRFIIHPVPLKDKDNKTSLNDQNFWGILKFRTGVSKKENVCFAFYSAIKHIYFVFSIMDKYMNCFSCTGPRSARLGWFLSSLPLPPHLYCAGEFVFIICTTLITTLTRSLFCPKLDPHLLKHK